MSQNAHILAECFCIIAQQSNSTDAPLLPKTWHFQAKHYFNNVRYDRKSAHLLYLHIYDIGNKIKVKERERKFGPYWGCPA